MQNGTQRVKGGKRKKGDGERSERERREVYSKELRRDRGRNKRHKRREEECNGTIMKEERVREHRVFIFHPCHSSSTPFPSPKHQV